MGDQIEVVYRNESNFGSKKYGGAEVFMPLLPCCINLVQCVSEADCDVVCIIGECLQDELSKEFTSIRKFDTAFDKVVSCYKSKVLDLPLIYSPIEQDLTDYHDVRSFHKAAVKGMKRIVLGGFKNPLFVVPTYPRFVCSHLCALLGGFEELYVPLQLREDIPEKERKLESLFVLIDNYSKAKEIFKDAWYLESGIVVARDIGMSDPERMSPKNLECYVQRLFENSPLTVTIINDPKILAKEYPLFAAVDRANEGVERHMGRIIYLEWKPDCPVDETLMLVGKGVTYDTGGADIKIGNHMSGMSRDKYGAAAVIGFMQLVSMLKPKKVHVISAICVTRNSIGNNCYVSDEIITARCGKRVRCKNTDAEGRMILSDVVCRLKEYAVSEQLSNPHIITIATLTGHARMCAGNGYAIVLDNSVAQCDGHALRLQAVGTTFGEPLEISLLRQDDFQYNRGKTEGEDLVQLGYHPSSKAPQRGHQVAAAFLMQASGLDEHGLTACYPIKFSHIDIAGSASNYPQKPATTPIISLAKTHLI